MRGKRALQALTPPIPHADAKRGFVIRAGFVASASVLSSAMHEAAIRIRPFRVVRGGRKRLRGKWACPGGRLGLILSIPGVNPLTIAG